MPESPCWLVSKGRGGNLKVAFGGGTEDGIFVQPTVVDGVGQGKRLFQEEIFGPVLSVTSFTTLGDAIELTNDSVYGLAASVNTDDLRKATTASRAIRDGVVTVNCFAEGDATTPFGGCKKSGFGGRDKSQWTHDQHTETETI